VDPLARRIGRFHATASSSAIRGLEVFCEVHVESPVPSGEIARRERAISGRHVAHVAGGVVGHGSEPSPAELKRNASRP
jgi:hypothetical protein